MDGFLNIDKPPGITSHDVVARVRRILKTKRVGHAGTLDPDATGVLVVAVGQATRLLPHIPTEPKEYIARICFGVATDTEDASGKSIAEVDASLLDVHAVEKVLSDFVGEIDQVPPMVSAVHHEGKRLYELARAGIEVEREPRRVTLHRIELSDFLPGVRAEATLRILCGGGTYIRTLCKDIGLAVGLLAHMKSLVREAVGPFRRDQALSLEAVDATCLVPMEESLDVPLVTIEDEDKKRLSHGMPVQIELVNSPEVVAFLYRERLCALARLNDKEYQPFKVFDGNSV